METVNTVVNAASKAIWGEQPDTTKASNETGGSEPVSGLQGKGTATEPYDQGNVELGEQHAKAATVGNETGGKEPVSGLQGEGSLSEPFDQGNAANPTDPIGKSNITDPLSTPKPDTTTYEPTSFEPYKPDTSSKTESTAPFSSSIPILPSKPVKVEESKPVEHKEPDGLEAPAEAYTFVDGKLVPEKEANKSGVPAGPSKDPVEAVGTRAITSKKGHGDELRVTRDHTAHASESNEPGTHDIGTEPQGVKTTSLLSEGGEFNATKHSTGKEADRIVEEKSEHRDAPAKVESPAVAPAAPASGEKEKVSKLGKLKDKLHIGSKDK